MNWFGGSVADAVNEAKRNGKLFLVYIEGTDEMSKQMSASYDDPAVAQKLSTENIIALKLAPN
ncbi:UBX domain-containing protein 4, partial [Stegodyphus mimosarum]